jgi:hypothetical protein
MKCIFHINQLDDVAFFEAFHPFTAFYIPPFSNDLESNNFSFVKGLRIGHVSIKGLFEKIDQLSTLLNDLNFDILLVSETHLNNDLNNCTTRKNLERL